MRTQRVLISIPLIILAISLAPPSAGYTIMQGSQITANNNYPSINPAILYYSQNKTAWVFWSTLGVNGNFDIYYRIMTPDCLQNACLLFPFPVHRLTFGPRDSQFSSVTETHDGKVWVFFTSDRGSPALNPKWSMYYKTFNGTTWSNDIQISPWVGDTLRRSISTLATSDGGLWVAWASNMTCTVPSCASNIAIQRYNGTAWSPPQNVTKSGSDTEPSLSQASNGTIWLSWANMTSLTNNSLYAKTFTPTGGMGPEFRLTSDPSDNEWPNIVHLRNGAQNGAVVLVWASDRFNMTGPSYDLFMRYSLNGGATWSTDIQLNAPTPPPDDNEPSATQIGPGRIGVVWQSDNTIPGSPNVFSMSILITDVGLTGISSSQTVIGQGLPLRVNVTLANNGWEPEKPTISLFGYLGTNGTLIQTVSRSVAFGGNAIASFAWNTTGWVRGKYLLRAVEGNLTGQTNPTDTTITMNTNLTLTIPGDVNGDGVVNILDLTAVALAFGSTRGGPGYNANADILQLGVINILDLVYVARRFGNTG